MAGDALKKRKKNRVSSSSPIPIEVDDTDTDKGKNDKDKDQDKDKDDGRDEWLPAPDDSDVESAVTDEEFDDPDQGYEVDAIKYARYVNAKRTRSDEHVGWLYGLMWNNYLKSGSESEEPRANFVDERGKSPMVDEFWKSVGKPILRGRKEPGGRLNERIDAPPKLLKYWFRRCTPRRDYAAYQRRLAKEREDLPILKRDSDYYINKKRIRLAQKEKEKEKGKWKEKEEKEAGFNNGRDGGQNAQAGPSNAERDGGASAPAPPSPAPSHGSSMYSLFSDSETDEEDDEQLVKRGRPAKRRRVIGSPPASPRSRKKATIEKERATEQKAARREQREAKSQQKADKISKVGKIKKRDDPFVLAPPAPNLLAKSASPIPRSSTKGSAASKVSASYATKAPNSAPVSNAPAPTFTPKPPAIRIKVKVEPSATVKSEPVAPPAAAPVAPPAAAPPKQPTSAPAIPNTSVFGTPDDGIFGKPDAGIFGSDSMDVDSVPSTSVREDSPAPSSPPRTRRNQPPLFDFGDSPTTQRIAIPESLLDGPGANGPETPSIPNASAALNALQLNSAGITATDSAKAAEPAAVESPAAAAPASTIPAVPEPPTEPAAPPSEQLEVPASLTVDTSAADEMPSSTPTNQIRAPNLTITEPTPQKAVPEAEPEPAPALEPTLAPPPPAGPPPPPPPPPEDAPSPGTSTSLPPKHHSLPLKPETTAAAGPSNPQVPTSERPKYQQPVRVRMIEQPVDPEGAQRLARRNARPRVSPRVPTSALPPRPPSPPPQQSLLQLAQDMRRKKEGARKKAQQQQWNQSGYGGRTPTDPAWYGGRSPTYGDNVVGSRSLPGQTSFGTSPQQYQHGQHQGHQMPPAFGQHAHPPPPQQQQQQPPSAVYEAKRDPRIRHGGAPAGLAAGPSSNAQPRPPAPVAPVGPSANPFLVTVADRRGQTEASFQFAVRDGATSRATHHLRRFASESRRRFEEMERGMLELVLAQGAAVIEWAQLSLQDPPPAVQSNWDVVRGQLANGRTFLCVEEIQQAVPLPSHIFVLIAAAENAHLDTVGLDPWTLEQIGVVAIVVNIPLQGHAIPTLPNPVRPDFLTGEQADQGRPPQDPMNIAESYGFTRATVEVGDTVMLYPPNDFGLYPHAVEQAKRLSLSPPKQPNGPHWMILLNNYWLKSTRSQSVATYLSRSTRIFAMGPDFDIPISQWGLREIWKKGGLVTFSPTLLLREPQRFAEIMEVIRVTPGWAAYIPPSTVLWCEESWHNRTRCPQSSMAFAALTSALFMDDQIMQLAGALQDDMGGLAVSYCPPHLAQREQCAKWIDWLRRVFQCDDYEALLKLCSEGYKAQAQAKQHRGSGSGSGPSQPAPLNLLDVEMNIVGDLVDMRQRPHIVPYRRFIYVGALSNRAEINRYYEKAVEFVDPQDFVAFLSGCN